MDESVRTIDTKMNFPPVSLPRDLAAPSSEPLSQVASSQMLTRNIYTDDTYLGKNPLWHADESPFKVKHILRMVKKHHLQPRTICEVGCGAGEVLRLLQQNIHDPCRFWGYDISPQAMLLCKNRTNDHLQFKLADLTREEGAFFDLLLVLDVFEHVEDYFGFLDRIRAKGDLKIFHIP